MKLKALLAGVASASLVATPLAWATPVSLSLSYTDATTSPGDSYNVEVLGTFTASDSGGGGYTVTGGTLSVTGGPAVLNGDYQVVPNPAAPAADSVTLPGLVYDNLVFPGGDPVVNFNGLLVLLAPENYLNIYFDNGHYSVLLGNPAGVSASPASYLYEFQGPASASAWVTLPTPVSDVGATALLLGLAVSGLGVLRRKSS